MSKIKAVDSNFLSHFYFIFDLFFFLELRLGFK